MKVRGTSAALAAITVALTVITVHSSSQVRPTVNNTVDNSSVLSFRDEEIAQIRASRSRRTQLSTKMPLKLTLLTSLKTQPHRVSRSNRVVTYPMFKKEHVSVSNNTYKAYALSLVGEAQFQCLEPLWEHESGWRTDATNPNGSAWGIPQALPGSKMASEGADWRTNGRTQIRWGVKYIAGRYGNSCGAWAHFQSHNWY